MIKVLEVIWVQTGIIQVSFYLFIYFSQYKRTREVEPTVHQHSKSNKWKNLNLANYTQPAQGQGC